MCRCGIATQHYRAYIKGSKAELAREPAARLPIMYSHAGVTITCYLHVVVQLFDSDNPSNVQLQRYKWLLRERDTNSRDDYTPVDVWMEGLTVPACILSKA